MPPETPTPPWHAWPKRKIARRLTEADLQAHLDALAKIAMDQYARAKDHEAELGCALVLFRENPPAGVPGTILMPIEMPDGALERDAISDAMENIRADPRVDAVGLITEVWMSAMSSRGRGEGPLPSEAPDRQERLLVIAAEKVLSHSRSYRIVREAGKGIRAVDPDNEALGPGRFLPDLSGGAGGPNVLREEAPQAPPIPWAHWPERKTALRASREQLEAFLDHMESFVIEFYGMAEKKDLPGFAFVRRLPDPPGPAEDHFILAPPMGGMKDILADALAMVRSDSRVDLTGFACEAWTSPPIHRKTGDPVPDTPPSEMPDRQEAVMIWAADKVQSIPRRLLIRRLENDQVVLERNDFPQAGSLASRFLPDLTDTDPPSPGVTPSKRKMH